MALTLLKVLTLQALHCGGATDASSCYNLSVAVTLGISETGTRGPFRPLSCITVTSQKPGPPSPRHALQALVLLGVLF